MEASNIFIRRQKRQQPPGNRQQLKLKKVFKLLLNGCCLVPEEL
jgi:hypothetical protein